MTNAQELIDNVQHAAKQAAGDQAEHVQLSEPIPMGNGWFYSHARVHGVEVGTVFVDEVDRDVRIESLPEGELKIAFANAGIAY
jgi:hypothetical protein